MPYSKLVGILSLFLAAGALYETGVQSKVWFVVGTIIVWIPLSMLWIPAYPGPKI
jgi:hypothetical protein